MQSTRIKYLDIASGIMVIWVLVFHAIYPMYGTDELKVIPWFYYFMPWFFYKAGMMFKPKDSKQEWKNSAKKLLVTFAVWSFIGWLAHIGWHLFIGDLTPRMAFYSPARSLLLSASVPLNGALWFLPILFLVRGIGNWLLRKNILLIGGIVGLCFTLFTLYVHIPFLPVYIGGTAWGLFFFAVGYWLRDKETNPWIATIAAIGFVASLFTDIPSVYCGVDNMLWKVLWYPACVCGCVTFNNMCRMIANASFVAHSRGGVLQHVGKNAMNYYAPHKIIFHLGFNLIAWFKQDWYSTWQGLLIVLAAYAVILPIINCSINALNAHRQLKSC